MSSQQSEQASKGTLLLADDNESVRHVTAYVLRRFGYTVLETADGGQALEVFQQRHADIAVIWTDIEMPGMNGLEFARKARELKPTVPIVFATGAVGQPLASFREEAAKISPFFFEKTGGTALIESIQKTLTAAIGK